MKLVRSLPVLVSLAAGLYALGATAQETLPRLMPDDLFRRNIGGPGQLDSRFPPHRIIDNVYYVGTESLGSFLITTDAGHILVNSDFERTVPLLRQSVEELGFDFEDIEIIIGSHEHGDHMEGDALAKQQSGAQVIAVAEQVPGLARMRPGGKPHPIDRVIVDGDTVELGGEVLTAHLTPGHSDGCTSWELEVEEDGVSYKVVIICSVGVNPNYQLWNNPERPDIVNKYRYSYAKLRELAADIPLGSHPSMYALEEKYPRIGAGPNPFIDPQGYLREIAINEQAMNLRLEEQRQAALSEEAGLSPERLQRIDRLVDRYIQEGRITGAVTLVARRGSIAHLEARGVMDLESRRPMETGTIFRLASMSKPVAALAILMLVEEGSVRLDDPVSRFLPSFASQRVATGNGDDTVPAQRPITVLDLLTHTSGVMSGPASDRSGQFLSTTRHEAGLPWVDELGAAPLEFQPGSRWAYSALAGFDVLSRIVELASGMSFDEFLRVRVFEPLGMENIFFWPADDERGKLVTSYELGEDGLRLRANPDSMSGERYFSGAGGLMADAESYARFAMLLAGGGELDGVRLLGTRAMELMRSAWIPDTLPGRNPGEGYGLGVRVVSDPLAMQSLLSEGAFGWSGFYGTYVFMDPQEELVGLLMIQSPARAMWTEFETAVMQALVD